MYLNGGVPLILYSFGEAYEATQYWLGDYRHAQAITQPRDLH